MSMPGFTLSRTAHTPPRLTIALGAAAVLAGLVAAPVSAPPAPAAHPLGVQLTTEHELLGGGTALILGPSLISTPSQQYLDTVDKLYLAPNGFTGSLQAVTTPESPFNLLESEQAGAAALTDAVMKQIDGGQVDADNPVVVFAYSQSAAFVTFTMQQLAAKGVPSEDVHFVLVGDPAAPNGGWLTALDIPAGTNLTIPALGIALGNATPDNLYPTDIYTLEYDGYADHPNHPLDLLTLVNAYLGLLFNHTSYLGLTPEQVAGAVPLDTTTADTMTDYHVIASDTLPLLQPLQLIPVLGQPLYDLMEPTMRILVNLGYGSIDEGWNQGPANVGTAFDLLLPNQNPSELVEALGGAASAGFTQFIADLNNPDTYQMMPEAENPVFASLIASAYGAGLIDTAHPASFSEVVDAFVEAFIGSAMATPA